LDGKIADRTASGHYHRLGDTHGFASDYWVKDAAKPDTMSGWPITLGGAFGPPSRRSGCNSGNGVNTAIQSVSVSTP
jgi:hypothetical protein